MHLEVRVVLWELQKTQTRTPLQIELGSLSRESHPEKATIPIIFLIKMGMADHNDLSLEQHNLSGSYLCMWGRLTPTTG